MNTITPRIYVASLSDYNNGRLHGRWIDANQDADAIKESISAMLAESSEPVAEEWAIHDYEEFGSIRLSEYMAIDDVAELAAMIDEHGEIFAEVVNHCGADCIDHAKSIMEDGYHGEWDSLEAYAENYIDDIGALNDMPDNLRYYFDYEKFARDLEIGGDVFTIEHDGKVHVFDGMI